MDVRKEAERENLTDGSSAEKKETRKTERTPEPRNGRRGKVHPPQQTQPFVGSIIVVFRANLPPPLAAVEGTVTISPADEWQSPSPSGSASEFDPRWEMGGKRRERFERIVVP